MARTSLLLMAGMSVTALPALAGSAPPAPICGGVPIAAMIDRYAGWTRAQESRSIALLYGAYGALDTDQGPIVGAAAIARYLSGFGGFKVTDNAMSVASVEPVAPHRWRVAGGFAQHGLLPDGQSYAAAGRWQGDWRCRHAHWQIDRMTTFPAKADR